MNLLPVKIFTPFLLLFAFVLNSCKRNSTSIQFDNNISKQDFKIKMEVIYSQPVTTIFDGKNEFPVPNGYGENEWYFLYKDSVKGYMRFIKTNSNDTHKYNFKVYQKDGRVMVDAEIKGVGGMKHTVILDKNQNR